MIRFLKLLILAPLAGATLSCGGHVGVTLSSAGQIATNFTQVVALIPRGQGAASLPTAISGNITTGLVRTHAALGCESSTPASPADVDADGVALLKEYTFNCSEFTSGTNSYSHQGSFKVTDSNDNLAGPLGGYRYDFDITQWDYKDLTTGLNSGGSYKGYWTVTGTSNSMTSKSVYNGTYHAQFNYAELGLVSVNYLYNYTWDVTVTFTGLTGNAYNDGSVNGKGTYLFSGTFMDETDGKHSVKTGDAMFTWETVNLTYDRTCSKYYKSGSYKLTDEGGSILEIVYSCSAIKVYLNSVLQETITL